MIAALLTAVLPACAAETPQGRRTDADPDSTLRTLVATVTGFSWPEAVCYDPEQAVYFVANFEGAPSELDNNGFITRVGPAGTIDNLRRAAAPRNFSRATRRHTPRAHAVGGDA